MLTESKLDYKAIDINKNLAYRNYWKNRLIGFEFNSYFLHKGSSENVNQNERANYSLCLPKQLVESLKSIAESDIAKHIILLSALGVLINKCSSISDIIIFTESDQNDQFQDNDNNVIPFRMNINNGASFPQLVINVKDSLLKDLRFSNYAIEKKLEEHFKNFDVLSAIAISINDVHSTAFRSIPVDLLFSFNFKNKCTLDIQYNTARFDSPFITQIADLFTNLLGNLLKNKNKSIKDIEVISNEEKNIMINEFNNTKKIFPQNKTVIDLFKEQVKAYPNKIAIQFQDQQLTYREFDCRSNQLANFLHEKSIGKGSVVGVYLDRSVDLMIAIYGIMKAGAIYLPLSSEHPIDRTNYLLKNSSVEILITTSQHYSKFSDRTTSIEISETSTYSKNWINSTKPDDVAYIIYTSGSTGNPKGVLIKHHSLVNRLNWMQNQYNLNITDIILQKTPVIFDVSIWELFWWSLNGAKLVLADPGAEKNPADLCKIIDCNCITTLHFVPSMLNIFLFYCTENKFKQSLISLKQIFSSGEELKSQDAKIFFDFFSHIKLHNLYGPTEATVDVSFYEIEKGNIPNKIPIGKPIDNTCLLVLNKDLQLQPIGFPGDLFIGGENLSIGYLNQIELTNERFIKNPYDNNSILYKTGDLARWLPDGNIEYLGRIDNQVKIRGNRIELEEIEIAIKSFNGIRNAIVLAKENNSAYHLVGFLLAEENFSEEELEIFLKSKLPDYMVPSYFILLDNIPTTVNGKVDRNKLLSLEKAVNKKYVAPSSKLEKILASIWTTVLGVEKISVDDNFFRIGGDSILAVRLIASINNELSTNLSMVDLYNNETINELSNYIEASKNKDSSDILNKVLLELEQYQLDYLSNIDNTSIEAVYPMSDIEKAMCYIHKSRPDDILYFEQIMKPVTYESLYIDVLQKALTLLIQKHEILRTGFDVDKLAHVVYKEFEYKIQFYDYSSFNKDIQKNKIKTYLESSRQKHFDLQNYPLWRIIVFKLENSYHEILFEYHHAIIDGWSIASLITELNNTYVTLLKDPDFRPKPLLANFKDYIIEELCLKQNKEPQEFWKAELKNYKKLKLRSRSDKKIFKSVREIYPRQLLMDLKKAAQQKNTVVKNILLAAYIYSLKVLTCENDILIGLVTFTRPLKEDGDKIIGCFLNTIPFRIIIPNKINWEDYLRLIDNKLLEVKKYEHLSLFEINQAIGSNIMEENPLFDTLFNFINWHIEKELQLDGMIDSETDRLDFDSFLRGHTFFDVNFNVNEERIYCMHEYSSPFMDEETYNAFSKIFLTILKKITDVSEETCDPNNIYWKDAIENTAHELLEYSQGLTSSDNLIPTSPNEEFMWRSTMAVSKFANKILPEYYNLPLIININGTLNIDCLEKSIQTIINKYEILRAHYIEKDGTLFRTIYKNCKVELSIENLITQTDIEHLVNIEIRKPFNVDELLFRAKLFKLNESEFKLVITLHHFNIDLYSVNHLTEELLSIYDSYIQKIKTEQKESFLSFSAFSQWQKESLVKLKPYLVAYWIKQLGTEFNVTKIPVDKPKHTKDTYSGAFSETIINESLTEELRKFEKSSGFDIEVILIASFKLLLNKYLQNEEIIIGIIADNRKNKYLKNLIGPASNVLPIKSSIKPNITFNEFLASLKKIISEGLQYQALPVNEILKEINPYFEPENQLVDILFQYNAHILNLGVTGLNFYIDDKNFSSGSYGLNLLLQPKEKIIQVKLAYNSNLYFKSTIELFLTHYCDLLKKVLSQPESKISTVSILNENEKTKILKQFNYTNPNALHDKTIIELFEDQVKRSPQNIAVETNTTKYTYNELNQQANKLAHFLIQEHKIKINDIVGVLMEKSDRLIISILAILKAGAAYLPIDPNYPEKRIQDMINDSGLKYLISDIDVPEDKLSHVQLYKDLQTKMPLYSDQNTLISKSNKNLFYVIYTSGSTGKPKGAMIRNESFVNLLYWYNSDLMINEKDVFLLIAPISFDLAQKNLFAPLIVGAKLYLSEEYNKDYQQIAQIINKKEVTIVNCSPSAFYPLLDETTNEDFKCLKSLKAVVLGGEPIHIDLFKKWKDSQFFSATIYNSYGPTECTDVVSSYKINKEDITENLVIPIGKPLQNTQIYILDSNNELKPVGLRGEICIGGICVSNGYLGNDSLTGSKFIPDPFIKGATIYKTGDIGFWREDGNIVFVGRVDDQIKIRGFRVETAEIEDVIKNIELVKEATVIAKEDSKGEKFIAAYYTSYTSKKITGIREILKERLPEHMIPSFIIHLDSMPLNPNGKLDKKALPEPELIIEEDFIKPTNEIETNLLEIWSEVLNINKNLISTNKSFFELGGHSLKVLMLTNHIKKQYQVTLSLKDVFARRTVKKLSDYIIGLKQFKNEENDDNYDMIEIDI